MKIFLSVNSRSQAPRLCEKSPVCHPSVSWDPVLDNLQWILNEPLAGFHTATPKQSFIPLRFSKILWPSRAWGREGNGKDQLCLLLGGFLLSDSIFCLLISNGSFSAEFPRGINKFKSSRRKHIGIFLAKTFLGHSTIPGINFNSDTIASSLHRCNHRCTRSAKRIDHRIAHK